MRAPIAGHIGAQPQIARVRPRFGLKVGVKGGLIRVLYRYELVIICNNFIKLEAVKPRKREPGSLLKALLK